MLPPIGKLVDCEFEAAVHKQCIDPLKIGVGRIGLTRDFHKALAQLFTRHAERGHVGSEGRAVVVVVQSTFLLQPVVQRRGRDGVQQPDKSIGNASVSEEFRKDAEDGWIVAIKADDHSTPHIEPMALYAVHTFEQGPGPLANIL